MIFVALAQALRTASTPQAGRCPKTNQQKVREITKHDVLHNGATHANSKGWIRLD